MGFYAVGVRVSNGLFGNGSSNVSISLSCFGASSVYGCDYSVTRTRRLRQFDTGIHCPAPGKQPHVTIEIHTTPVHSCNLTSLVT